MGTNKNNAVAKCVPSTQGAGRRGALIRYAPNKQDRQRVKDLVLLGTPDEVIATCIGERGIDSVTMKKYYHEELTRHKEEMLGKIATGAYRAALPVDQGGDPLVPPDVRSRMQIFVLKTRGGWREQDTTIINAHNVQIVKRVVGVGEGDI